MAEEALICMQDENGTDDKIVSVPAALQAIAEAQERYRAGAH